MKKSMHLRESILPIAILVLSQTSCTSALAENYNQTMAAYREKMRAYHEKLLAYQVLPGNSQAERKAICDNLKTLTRGDDKEADGLWNKLFALEKQVNSSNKIQFAATTGVLIKEVNARLSAFNQQQQTAADQKVKGDYAAGQAAGAKAEETFVTQTMGTHVPSPGALYKRRLKIWDELKRDYAQKKYIANHVRQYLSMDASVNNGASLLSDQCKKLEDSLGIKADPVDLQ